MRTTVHSISLLACVALKLFPITSYAEQASQPTLTPLAKAFDEAVTQGEIAGGVALVWRDGQLIHRQAVGLVDVQARRAAREDDLYWIASMTKPMAAAAIMMLADEQRISIDDPLEKYLPEFASPRMISNRQLKQAAQTQITLRHLLTHTSGLPEAPIPPEGTSLTDWVLAAAKMPLLFEPGSRWAYSNTGINALGRVVEVVTGKPFEEFLDERLFKPLGMRSTTFHPTGPLLDRVVKSYKINPAKREFTEIQHPLINGPVESPRRTVLPAGGLYSTADDVLRFYEMMLAGGVFDGKRLLSAQAVGEMTRVQTGDLETGFVEGMSFGFGFGVVKSPQGRTSMLSAGTFGHGGAYGTASWADPKRRVILIIMIQRSNFSPHADGDRLRETIFRSAFESISNEQAQHRTGG